MMTLRAYAHIVATSSIDAVRTDVCLLPAATAPSVATAAPNAPNNTLPRLRFIAFAMSIVSSVPDAPTSVPLMMSTVLFSTKPVIATATPVNEFNSEMTTGMSAPPIGSTAKTPSISAAATKPPNTAGVKYPSTSATARPTTDSAINPLTNCWPVYVIGRPVMSSWSFANATSEPANEIEPMIVLKMIGTKVD